MTHSFTYKDPKVQTNEETSVGPWVRSSTKGTYLTTCNPFHCYRSQNDYNGFLTDFSRLSVLRHPFVYFLRLLLPGWPGRLLGYSHDSSLRVTNHKWVCAVWCRVVSIFSRKVPRPWCRGVLLQIVH